MSKFGMILVAATIGILVLFGFLLHSLFGDPLGRYVVSPVPESVRKVGFKGNGLGGILSVEPVVHIAFTANSADIETIVRKGGFKTGSANDREFVGQRSGPIWWKSGPLQNTDVLFMRKGRAGQEYLRIDGSGTNAYFLLWGI
jgi:hypothetical protein